MEPSGSKSSFSPGPSDSISSPQRNTNLPNDTRPSSNKQSRDNITLQNPPGRGIFQFLEAHGLERRQMNSQRDTLVVPQVPSMDQFPSPGSLPKGISRETFSEKDLWLKKMRVASIKRQELLDPRLRPCTINPLVLKEFHPFINLPPELRVMIWKLALPGPRIVDIRLLPLKKTQTELDREKGNDPNSVKWSEWVNANDISDEYIDTNNHRPDGKPPLVGVKSQCTIPSLLLVNREANDVAARWYEREFSSHESVAETYFDYRIDTLYMRYSNFNRSVCTTKSQRHETVLDSLKKLKTESLEKVKRLALSPDLGSIRHMRQPLDIEIAEILSIFKGVAALTIVAHHYDSSSIWHIDRSPISLIEPIDLRDTFYSYCFSAFTNKLDPFDMPPTKVSNCLAPVIFSTNRLHATVRMLRMLRGEKSEHSKHEGFPSVHVMISITEAIVKPPRLVFGAKHIDVKHFIPINLRKLALELSKQGPLSLREVAEGPRQNSKDEFGPLSSAYVEISWKEYLKRASLQFYEYTEEMRKNGKVWWVTLGIGEPQV